MCPLRAVLAALAASAALTACGTPCAQLSHALCDGGDPAYCEQVDGWLQQRLIDPETKEPLVGEARDQMCGTIHKSVDVFNAYRFKAKQKLLGVPDFTLASSTPAANKADPTPEPVTPANKSASKSEPVTPVKPVWPGVAANLPTPADGAPKDDEDKVDDKPVNMAD